MNTNNDNIIDLLRQGDEEAYKTLYKLHYRPLCVVAFGFVQDSFVAETLVSDVIFSIWENRSSLLITKSLRAYLVKSVRNRCINYLEHCLRQDALKQSVAILSEEKQSCYESQSDFPLCNLLEKELDERIKKSINSFPELTRNIFYLSRYKGLKYEEIARQLAISTDTVKYHIKSALTRLRNDLQDYLVILLVFFSAF